MWTFVICWVLCMGELVTIHTYIGPTSGTYVGLPHIKCGINPNKEQVQRHGSLNIMCKQHWNMDIIITRG